MAILEPRPTNAEWYVPSIEGRYRIMREAAKLYKKKMEEKKLAEAQGIEFKWEDPLAQYLDAKKEKAQE